MKGTGWSLEGHMNGADYYSYPWKVYMYMRTVRKDSKTIAENYSVTQ
jgi:hypothetical protein